MNAAIRVLRTGWILIRPVILGFALPVGASMYFLSLTATALSAKPTWTLFSLLRFPVGTEGVVQGSLLALVLVCGVAAIAHYRAMAIVCKERGLTLTDFALLPGDQRRQFIRDVWQKKSVEKHE